MGFRPGRIDETFQLRAPSIDVRRAFFDAYLPPRIAPEIVEAVVVGSTGLTGAYLVDFARRIEVHGSKGWKGELRALRLSADLSGTVRAKKEKAPAKKNDRKRPVETATHDSSLTILED